MYGKLEKTACESLQNSVEMAFVTVQKIRVKFSRSDVDDMYCCRTGGTHCPAR